MAVTQLLAQNDNTAEQFLKNNVGHSVIPLSHTVMFPTDVDGAILPCCLIETVPTDRFQISNEILLRQLQPLKVPQMTRYTLNTAYFYCSNRLGWKKWSMFADQANKGRVNYSFDLPRVTNIAQSSTDNPNKYSLVDVGPSSHYQGKNQNYNNTLHTYFDISLNRNYSTLPSYDNFADDSSELPLAFPFFDYQMICRDFYTNIDRLTNNPGTTQERLDFNNPLSDWAFTNLYPVDDDELRLQDGIHFSSGFISGDDDNQDFKGFILDKVRYHDVRDDYFTSSKRAPMRGEAPTIDTTVAVTSVDASKVILPDDFNQPTSLGATVDNVNVIRGAVGSQLTDYLGNASISSSHVIGNNSATHKIAGALSKLKINLQTTKAINAAELRLLSQLTVWQELNMLHKPTYNDFLNAHYNGVKVGDSLVETPQYIGGTSQVIQINEVLQTSESTDSSKLGTQAAVAHSLSSSNVGSFFCPDYGFIIGVMYILPDLMYKPALPRWSSRRTIEDYYFPEFANLSMQATLNKELFFSNDSEWNNQALGYVGAYDEMRTIPNYCAGQMLDDNNIDLQRWALLRKFENSNKPAINQNFLTSKGNIDKSAWSAPEQPKFMFQCANYIKAVRPMPYIAVPKPL